MAKTLRSLDLSNPSPMSCSLIAQNLQVLTSLLICYSSEISGFGFLLHFRKTLNRIQMGNTEQKDCNSKLSDL